VADLRLEIRVGPPQDGAVGAGPALGDASGMKGPGLQVRLLGPVRICRDGAPISLPRSRKVRALLAVLTLDGPAVSRTRLCDLLWDVPNDPRGELRWCLSKLRRALDDAGRPRVLADDHDLISLDLSDCLVDALEIERAAKAGLDDVPSERLDQLCELFGGELLEGVDLDGAEITVWLVGHRQRFRELRVSLQRQRVARAGPGSEERFRHLAAWVALEPFEQRAHEAMLEALAERGRFQEAERHLAAAIRSFEQQGLDWAPLREAWQRRRAPTSPRIEVAAAPRLPPSSATSDEETQPRRASIAIMPFRDTDAPGHTAPNRFTEGVTEDVITRLAKLRALFVIARGTVYALRDRGVGPDEAASILNVDYLATGFLRRQGSRSSLVVELVQTKNARIIWTDEFEAGAQTFAALDAIVDRIVAAIAEEIEAEECRRAILRPPSSLDAWEAYHRGLWHMYRFNGPDNVHAADFFRAAIRLDPTFSRAHAGLSFTHFQNAFLNLTADRERQVDLALETANQSLSADDRDPAAHWAMGRALWLRREASESLLELERSIELSPNFALGHYTLGFVHSQTGDPRVAIASTDHSRELSPFDPLQFAMLASRAMAHVRLGQFQEASEWALKAAARPNAHTHILAIAAECLALVNRGDQGRQLVGRIRERVPGYGVGDFLRAFHFDRETERLFRRAAKLVAFDAR
jgi:DNA-binding SARP family transcriptional activator